MCASVTVDIHPVEIACLTWVPLAIITSQILAEAQDRGFSDAAVLHRGLAHGSLLRNQRQHMQLASPRASAPAHLSEPPDHGFSSWFSVQDEWPSPNQSYSRCENASSFSWSQELFLWYYLIKAPIQYLGCPGIINHEIKFNLCSVQINSAGITLADWHLPCSSSGEPLLSSLF